MATKGGEGEKRSKNTHNLRTKQFQARQDTSITDLSLNWSPSLKQALHSVVLYTYTGTIHHRLVFEVESQPETSIAFSMVLYTHTQAQYTVIIGNKAKI